MRYSFTRSILPALIVLLFVLFSLFFDQYKPVDLQDASDKQEYIIKETRTEKGITATVFDLEGNPAAFNGYYTSIEKYYDSENRLICEKYFYDGEPVPYIFGYYGVQYEYNDKNLMSVITFLDVDGNPMMGTAGYSSIIKTYYDDGKIKEERYLDLEGNPAKKASGWYGVIHVGDKLYYLDENGNVKLDIGLFFRYYPWLNVIIGILLCIVLVFTSKKASILITLVYLVFILLQTLIGREIGTGTVCLDMFWSYRQFFSSQDLRVEILNNIWLFIPLGAGIYSIYRKFRYILFAFVVSVMIEILQFILSLGLFEMDDIFSNSIGAMMGFLIAYGLKDIETCRRKPINNQISTL